MTVTSGYPDYQRLSAQSGDQLGVWQPTINGDEVLDIIDCHGYGYIDFSVNDFGGSAYFTVTLSFNTNSNGTNEAASFEFIPTPNGEQTLQFPVIARYCKVIVNWISGVKTDTPFLFAFGCNAIAPDRMTSQPAAPLIFFAPTIAAGAKSTQAATTTVQGGAILAINASVSNKWSAWLKYYDPTAAAFMNYIVAYGSSYGQTAIVTIALPPTPFEIEVDNNDTVAQSFHISVTML